MTIFGIAGLTGCPNFTHAIHVANFLQQHLPDFTYYQIEKQEGAWQIWLQTLNEENAWFFTTSPVIWKELTYVGGKKYLVGGLSEFWEYCYDYYGFCSYLTKTDLAKIIADNQFLNQRKGTEQPSDIKTVTITSAANRMTEFLIAELQIVLKDNNNLIIKLYEEDLIDEKVNYLLELVEEIKPILTVGSNPKIILVTSIEEALDDCDLLLIPNDFTRKENENLDEQLKRCHVAMDFLAEDINRTCKRQLKIIFCGYGPLCFTATVLVEHCTKIRPSNIVVVTSDEGFSYLTAASKQCEINVQDMCCPPVYGFSGLNSYVDLNYTVILANTYKPYPRSVKTKEQTVLQKGVVEKELRLLRNFIDDEDSIIAEVAERKKNAHEALGRAPIFSKIRAVSSLMKFWFSNKKDDEIISLGICSNGSFGIPAGIIFSQPAMLDERNLWKPFSYFPICNETREKIAELVEDTQVILQMFHLGHRFL